MKKTSIALFFSLVGLLLLWWISSDSTSQEAEEVAIPANQQEFTGSPVRLPSRNGSPADQRSPSDYARIEQRNPTAVRKDLAFFVFDKGTEEPIEGALVEFYRGFWIRGNPIQERTTDAQGFVQLEGIPPGLYSVDFSREGYHFKRVRTTIQAHLTYGKKAIGLMPEVRVSGYVNNQNGDPIVGAGVTLSPLLRDNLSFEVPPVANVRTDENGFFEARTLEAFHNVLAFKSGYERYQGQIAINSEENAPLEITLERLEDTIRLTGQVVDESGNPVEGAGIRISSLKLEEKEKFIAGDIRRAEAVEITDAQGRFSFDIQRSPGGGVVAEKWNYLQARHFIDLTQSNDVQIVLTKPRTFEVRVLDHAGDDVTDFVTIRGFSPEDDRTQIVRPVLEGFSRKGTHREPVASNEHLFYATEYPFAVWADGMAMDLGMSETMHIEDYQPVISLTLQESDREIRGRILNDDGAPARQFLVTLTPDRLDGSRSMIGKPIFSEDGSFVIRNIPWRTFDLRISGPGYKSLELPKVTLNEGQPLILERVLEVPSRR